MLIILALQELDMTEKSLQIELENAQADLLASPLEHSNESSADSLTPSGELDSEDAEFALQDKLEYKKKELVGCSMDFLCVMMVVIFFIFSQL